MADSPHDFDIDPREDAAYVASAARGNYHAARLLEILTAYDDGAAAGAMRKRGWDNPHVYDSVEKIMGNSLFFAWERGRVEQPLLAKIEELRATVRDLQDATAAIAGESLTSADFVGDDAIDGSTEF